MVNDRNVESTPAVSVRTRNRSSKAAKLVQAAALAAALVPLGSVAAEASSITNIYSGGSPSRIFDFGPYEFDLSFDTPSGPEFIVQVTDNLVTQDDLTGDERLNNFPGSTCVPIADGLETCVDFDVVRINNDDPNNPFEEPLLPGDDTFRGFFNITIKWDAITDFDFPNDPGNRIRILHNKGSIEGDAFDTDITVDGSYVGSCIECSLSLFSVDDPEIGGKDDNFQSFLVAQAPATVPEPGTVLLVTTGVGLLYRRRRRKQDAELADPQRTTSS